ncbi:Complex I intermediate-associated protein 30, mitochondrial [Anthophora plagiata]
MLSHNRKFKKIRKEWKGEWEKHVQQLREKFNPHMKFIAPNEDDVVWKFNGTTNSLDQWVVNCDRDYGHGYSTAKLELSSNGTGIFHGVLDTRVAKDGRTTHAGYCNITSVPKYLSFRRKVPHDWTNYNELVLRVRGDGRCYLVNILSSKNIDITWFDAYNYIMYTRGGPYWQVIRIPFSKFVYTRKAELHEVQSPLTTNVVKNLGITIADKKPGPFRLEIDHISVCYNPTIYESFAYEMYDVERDN